ncbi:MAG: nitrate/nitrite transporter NrtS [Paludibacter sp.]|nr:nitrate/nitrite transporter NrtS [Paludibacter sp.]
MNIFSQQAFEKQIVLTALKVAIVVGTILNLINQWNSIIGLDFERISIFKMLLTYCVPYLVSTYSAVKAM